MEQTHTNKIIYITIGVVIVIIAVLALMRFLGPSSTNPADNQTNTLTLEQQMTAEGGSKVGVEEQGRVRVQSTASGGNKLSPAEQARLKDAMTAGR